MRYTARAAPKQIIGYMGYKNLSSYLYIMRVERIIEERSVRGKM